MVLRGRGLSASRKSCGDELRLGRGRFPWRLEVPSHTRDAWRARAAQRCMEGPCCPAGDLLVLGWTQKAAEALWRNPGKRVPGSDQSTVTAKGCGVEVKSTDLEDTQPRSSRCGSVVTKPTSIRVQSLASLGGSGIWRCCELWCRLAAVAPISPRTWEIPICLE